MLDPTTGGLARDAGSRGVAQARPGELARRCRPRMRRSGRTARPLLARAAPAARSTSSRRQRADAYKAAAHVLVDTAGRSPAEVAAAVLVRHRAAESSAAGRRSRSTSAPAATTSSSAPACSRGSARCSPAGRGSRSSARRRSPTVRRARRSPRSARPAPPSSSSSATARRPSRLATVEALCRLRRLGPAPGRRRRAPRRRRGRRHRRVRRRRVPPWVAVRAGADDAARAGRRRHRRQDRRSTCPRARTSSAPSTSPSPCCADVDHAGTLPPREYRAGLGEVAKYALHGRRRAVAPRCATSRRRRPLATRPGDPRPTSWPARRPSRPRVVSADERGADRPAGHAQLRPHPRPTPSRPSAATGCSTARRWPSAWCSPPSWPRPRPPPARRPRRHEGDAGPLRPPDRRRPAAWPPADLIALMRRTRRRPAASPSSSPPPAPAPSNAVDDPPAAALERAFAAVGVATPAPARTRGLRGTTVPGRDRLRSRHVPGPAPGLRAGALAGRVPARHVGGDRGPRRHEVPVRLCGSSTRPGRRRPGA